MADNTAVVKSQRREIAEYLQDKKINIANMLPAHMDVDKYINSAIMAVAVALSGTPIISKSPSVLS